MTDPGTDLTYDWEAKPGISNLLELFSVLAGPADPGAGGKYANTGYGAFKAAAAEAMPRAWPDSGEIREP